MAAQVLRNVDVVGTGRVSPYVRQEVKLDKDAVLDRVLNFPEHGFLGRVTKVPTLTLDRGGAPRS